MVILHNDVIVISFIINAQLNEGRVRVYMYGVYVYIYIYILVQEVRYSIHHPQFFQSHNERSESCFNICPCLSLNFS